MSTPCEEIRPELEALLGAMTDGSLDVAGKKRLAVILREHPDARQFYLDYCQMHALLQSAHGVLQALHAPSALRRRRLWGVAAAAAALLAVGVLILRESSRLAVSVATVEGSVSIVRGNQRVPLTQSRDLREGDRLVTGAGSRTEVRTPDGSTVELLEKTDVRLATSHGRGTFELKDGTVRCDIIPRPASPPMIFSTPHAEAAILGTSFELAVGWNETRLHTFSGRVRLTSEGQSAEVGPGEKAVATEGKVVRWTPVCDLDFTKMKELPAQMETGFCPSSTYMTPARKVVPAPERVRWVEGGLTFGPPPGTPMENGLIELRWKEGIGEDVMMEAEVAAGQKWGLGLSVSGSSFEGYRVFFAAIENYPNGVAIDTIAPMELNVFARDSRPISFERDHTLRVERRGARIRAWVDGQIRIDTEVSHPLDPARKRSVSMCNFGSPPVIRSFRVWKAQ